MVHCGPSSLLLQDSHFQAGSLPNPDGHNRWPQPLASATDFVVSFDLAKFNYGKSPEITWLFVRTFGEMKLKFVTVDDL